MTQGPGKYDDACSAARERTGAQSVALIVFGGKFGSGFSVQGTGGFLLELPQILRYTADQIERDNVEQAKRYMADDDATGGT